MVNTHLMSIQAAGLLHSELRSMFSFRLKLRGTAP